MDFVFYSPSIGPPWDHTQLLTGLGGSETYHVELAVRLAARGHSVTSFNNLTDATDPRGYHALGVHWRHNQNVDFRLPGVWVVQRKPEFIDKFPGTERPTGDAKQRYWLVFHDFDYSEATERCLRYNRLLSLSKSHSEYLINAKAGCTVTLSAGGIPTARILAVEASGQEHAENCNTRRLRDAADIDASGGCNCHSILARNPQRIIFTSTPDRGLEPLLKSFSRAKEVVPNLELHCYYGWQGFDLRMQNDTTGELKRQKASIERLLQQEGVTFHGKVTQAELFNAYLQSGIWCYQTMFFEVFCCCAAEAQACGAVPIFNPLWALRDNVKYGIALHGDAWKDRLVATRYAYEIARLATAPEVQEKMREPMMPWARKEFDWERVVDQYEDMADIDFDPASTVVDISSKKAPLSTALGDSLPKDRFVKRADGTMYGGWFGDENKRRLEELIAKHDVKTVVEIGSFLGYSTAWFARRVDHVTCVDTFKETATTITNNNLVGILPSLGIPNDFYSHFESNMKHEGVWDKISVVHGNSAEVAAVVETADLIYIDGDHSYDGCRADIIAYLPKAKKVICGDDYTPAAFPGVIKATAEFVPCHRHDGAFWWYDDQPSRCLICDGPLKATIQEGCVPGNCSYQPKKGTIEHARIEKRRRALAGDTLTEEVSNVN